jgi:type III secretion protein T
MVNQPLIIELTNTLFPLLVAWAMFSLRAFGLTLFFAPFSFLALPLSMRFAFAASLGLPPLASITATEIQTFTDMSSVQLATIAVKELIVGIGLGIVAGLPFWAAQNAGELIDTYRGSSAGTLFDPTLTTESSELGLAFLLAAIAIVVWTGGLMILVGAVYASYQIWPLLDVAPSLDLLKISGIGSAVTKTLWAALSISGVILVALFTIDLAFALASRSTRQFQVFELSFNLKNLVFAFLMPILILPILQLLGFELSTTFGSLTGLLEQLK